MEVNPPRMIEASRPCSYNSATSPVNSYHQLRYPSAHLQAYNGGDDIEVEAAVAVLVVGVQDLPRAKE